MQTQKFIKTVGISFFVLLGIASQLPVNAQIRLGINRSGMNRLSNGVSIDIFEHQAQGVPNSPRNMMGQTSFQDNTNWFEGLAPVSKPSNNARWAPMPTQPEVTKSFFPAPQPSNNARWSPIPQFEEGDTDPVMGSKDPIF